jgi:hypothetical protein
VGFERPIDALLRIRRKDVGMIVHTTFELRHRECLGPSHEEEQGDEGE